MVEVIGETVGSYRIVSKLSVGGMGTVYRAEHTLLGQLAAVKVLHPELSGSRDLVQRFVNEAKAATLIKHPGIVQVFDYGYMASGHAFMTMELLDGMSLARRVKTGGKMSEGEAAMLLRSLCSALAAAHANGIVHRDLKPDNIFLVNDADAPTGYRPKILDFGIAKLTDIGLAGTATKTGAVMGTPTYMSPEQCRGTGDVDHRADLYSLGCIFYELVTGRPPFSKLGAGELIGAHIYATPDRPSKHLPTISKETEVLIMALLEKKPERRPQSARELAQRLQTLATNLGWITQSSPEGVTARSLQNLSTEALSADGSNHMTALDGRLLTTAPPTYDPSKTTPIGSGLSGLLSASDVSAAEPVEQPTTLSGAASQSMHDAPRRSKKPLGIAMLSAAVLAGGAVAAVKLTGSEPAPSGAAATAPKPEPLPTPEPVKAAPPPVETKPAPVETKPEPVPVPPSEPAIAPPADPPMPVERPIAKKATVKPKLNKKPLVKPTPTPTPKPDPKPDPKGCEQPPYLERDGL